MPETDDVRREWQKSLDQAPILAARVSPETLARVKAEANQRNTSMSAVVVGALVAAGLCDRR